jgi:hypothetical protein
MASDIIPFNPSAMPAHIATFMEDPKNSNIQDKNSTPTLSPAGKAWTVIINGEKTSMMKRNSEGDEEPIPVFRAVVVDYAKQRGRSYYTGTYDPNEIKAPDCWSNDGRLPDPSIAVPVSKKCEGCPMSAKGSKIVGTRSMVACSSHLMLAVIPASKLDFTPMRLKLAITSIWDKEGKDQQAQGWFAWDQYVDYLRQNGVKNTAAVLTKIKFDPATEYPKMLFNAGGWLPPEKFAQALDVAKTEDVKALLTRAWAAKAEEAEAPPAEEVEAKEGPTPAPAKATTQKAQAKPPEPPPIAATADDGDDEQEVILPGTAAPKADMAKPVQGLDPKRAAAVKAAEAKAALLRAQLAAAQAESDAAQAEADAEEGETQAAAPAPKAAAPKATATAPKAATVKATAKPATNATTVTPAVPAGVADLLETWGEE